MMGFPISGPSYIYWDNMLVINHTSRPELVFRKKSNSVCYHTVCDSVAMGKSIAGHIRSKVNVTDLMKRAYMGTSRDIWSVIFFIINMMTINYQY